MKSRLRVLVISSILGLVCAAGVVPAAAEQTTRTTYVTVLENDGQPVAGLTPADLRLRENNRDREIVTVEPATEPMRVALMVEETLTPAGGVRQGLFELVKALQGKAEMSLVVVGLSNRTAVPYTTDVNALVAGLNDLPLNQRQQSNHVPEGIADMARTEAMYMRDVLTGGLIRLPGGDSRLVTTLLRSGWVDAASVLVGDEATVS